MFASILIHKPLLINDVCNEVKYITKIYLATTVMSSIGMAIDYLVTCEK
jgi:hypothetical protein